MPRPVALVIDEDDLVLKMLSKALSLLGFDPRGVRGGLGGILEDVSPAAVLIDPSVATNNGLELLAGLKERCPAACIVLLIGRVPGGGDPATTDQYIRSGADVVLRKPVEIEKLKAALAGACLPVDDDTPPTRG